MYFYPPHNPPSCPTRSQVKRPVSFERAYVTRTCLHRAPASTAALQRSLRTMFTNRDCGNDRKGRLTRSVRRGTRAVGAPHGRGWEPLLPSAECCESPAAQAAMNGEARAAACSGRSARAHTRLLLLTWKPSRFATKYMFYIINVMTWYMFQALCETVIVFIMCTINTYIHVLP